jgi:hypothetical protein
MVNDDGWVYSSEKLGKEYEGMRGTRMVSETAHSVHSVHIYKLLKYIVA